MSMSAANSIRKPPSGVAPARLRSIHHALPIGEPVGHRAGLERADERIVERPGAEHHCHRRRRSSGHGSAGAVVAARPVDRFGTQLLGRRLQLDGERAQLVQLAPGGADLRRDQLMEPPLHRPALLAVPDGDEIGDLLERAPELLRPGDECQSGQRVLVVQPVAGVRSGCRLHQADAFVVAQRGGTEAAALRHLADRVAAHPSRVKVRPGSKVKACRRLVAGPQRAAELTRKPRPRPPGLPPEHTMGRPGLGAP